MKKFFSLILFFLTFAGVAFGENIKFAQITDVHFDPNFEYSKKVLESAIEDINSQSEISFVVFTGDNIDVAKPSNLKALVPILKKLNIPYYVVIGNHDVYKSNNLSKVRYMEILRDGNPFYKQKNANYKFSKDGFVFVTLDGAKEVIPGATGFYKESTLKWLDKTLTKNKKKPVVIFQHFPVEYPNLKASSRRLKTHETYKVEEYKKILEKHNNVLAIVSGHFHINYETMKNGVYHISTPSLMSLPHSYKIIDVVTTPEFSPLIYTQLREFEVKTSD